MNSTQLPAPPDPSSAVYSGNSQAWQRAAYQWMQQVKGRIETDSAVNASPVGPFVVGTYTLATSVSGTDPLSNFVASVVKAMLSKGLLTSSTGRTN
jgi:hypothetical protein